MGAILPFVTLYRAIRDMDYFENLKKDYRHFFKIIEEVNAQQRKPK